MTKRKYNHDFLPNCLAVQCPELAKDWHPTKNLPLTTFSVAYGSGKKVWWQCRECKHEWQAHINNRRKQYKYAGQSGTGCPNCVSRKRKEEAESWKTKNHSMLEYGLSSQVRKKTKSNSPIT